MELKPSKIGNQSDIFKTFLSLKPEWFRLMQMPRKQVDEYWNSVKNDSSFKGAFGRHVSHIHYQNQISSKEDQIRFCRETVYISPIVIYMTKDFYLLEEINSVISKLNAAGLVKFWYEQYFDSKKSEYEDQIYPKALNINDVTGALMLMFIGNCISTFIFLCEQLSYHISCTK